MRLPTLASVVAPLLALTALAAQSPAKLSPKRFGLIAGINQAKLGGSDAQGSSSHTGFLLGGLLAIPVRENISVQPELLFSMKGSEDNSSGNSATLKMNYLEVPVLLRFDVPVVGSTKPFVYAGPALSFQLSCDIGASGGGTTVSFTCVEAARQFGASIDFYKFDPGVLFGGGIAFDVGGRVMSLGARYNFGLGKISSDADTKNRVLSFVGSFEWPFGS